MERSVKGRSSFPSLSGCGPNGLNPPRQRTRGTRGCGFLESLRANDLKGGGSRRRGIDRPARRPASSPKEGRCADVFSDPAPRLRTALWERHPPLPQRPTRRCGCAWRPENPCGDGVGTPEGVSRAASVNAVLKFLPSQRLRLLAEGVVRASHERRTPGEPRPHHVEPASRDPGERLAPLPAPRSPTRLSRRSVATQFRSASAA